MGNSRLAIAAAPLGSGSGSGTGRRSAAAVDGSSPRQGREEGVTRRDYFRAFESLPGAAYARVDDETGSELIPCAERRTERVDRAFGFGLERDGGARRQV